MLCWGQKVVFSVQAGKGSGTQGILDTKAVCPMRTMPVVSWGLMLNLFWLMLFSPKPCAGNIAAFVKSFCV